MPNKDFHRLSLALTVPDAPGERHLSVSRGDDGKIHVTLSDEYESMQQLSLYPRHWLMLAHAIAWLQSADALPPA